jgi:NMD protein affecting ribosome stability and mRNA decay
VLPEGDGMNSHATPPKGASARNKSDRRRAGRAQRDHITDTYKQTAKPHEPTVCTRCGAVYAHGRWQWLPRPEAAQSSLCPACHRIEDRFPAGVLTVAGSLVGTHKDEIVRLARHHEQIERAEHPLNRIVAIDEKAEDRIEITTTDIHLPHRIANALRHAYKGEVTEHFDEGGYFVRVNWNQA